jgi:putative copper resistance protein D
VDELIVASRAVHFAALALVLGAPLFRLAIAPRGAARGWPGGRAIELAAALAALVSGLGWFAGVAATFAGGWRDALAPDILQGVTFETRFGHLWIGRLVVLAAVLAVQAWTRPSWRRDGVLVALAAALSASLIGVGHGMTGAGGGPAVARAHMVADVVHLICAMGWIGGLFCLAQVLRRGAADAAELGVVLSRFSRLGYWLVALLLVSGCVNALVLVPRPDSLLTSDYGRVLLVKLGLVLIMVGFALYNRLALVARVQSKAGAQALWRSVLAEQGMGALVLATVALLGTIHPVP